MLKELAVITSLTVSSLSFAASDLDERDKPKKWWELTDSYTELMQEYKEVSESNACHEEKVRVLESVTERMRQLGEDGVYLNEDYNKCMQESNAQQRSDYDRCDRNGGGDKCYDRADKNNNDRRAACERIAHSDNVTSASKKN